MNDSKEIAIELRSAVNSLTYFERLRKTSLSEENYFMIREALYNTKVLRSKIVNIWNTISVMQLKSVCDELSEYVISVILQCKYSMK